MSTDKPKHVVEEIVGKIKEEWGEYTGNEALRVEGEAELEQAKEDLKRDDE
ncbi:CsbD family protein [Kibdelosporangium philippinense]|uniref:CsbD family protein n=1 Tax=Kibdelosporangium philippinense TaxID=211113 RepID=A0ABS8ZUD1_9PSEU|nr:CsbD family protein [Kibdelosporangium philippinense]MCE7011311.1 CsbD family protein [Kibdelosporangium philippinense]